MLLVKRTYGDVPRVLFSCALQGDSQRAIERTIGLLNDGTLTLPPAATPDDVWMFLRSGGRTGRKPRIEAMATLGDVIDAYFDSIPAGAKSDNSLQTERIHTRHFGKMLWHLTPLQKIGPAELQGYVSHRARRVSATTIEKELQTFHQIRDFALARGLVTGELPRKQVRLPKPPDKPPFATRDEIARQLDLLGLTGKEADESGLWECLYLREAEVLDLLAHVKRSAAHPFIYPMVAMPAFTGCRRSEMLRSQVSDFDLEGGTVLIREKKRRQDRSLSFRRAELNARLKGRWFGASARYGIRSSAPAPPRTCPSLHRRLGGPHHGRYANAVSTPVPWHSESSAARSIRYPPATASNHHGRTRTVPGPSGWHRYVACRRPTATGLSARTWRSPTAARPAVECRAPHLDGRV